jgi:choline dehydrogenase
VRFDVVVVGGGTAGCVLASRLTEDPDRRVCLLEAGPDYGPLAEGRWPSEILDARTTAPTHLWGSGAVDGRSLGGRVLGGSSSVNACMVVQGTSADYDEWGSDWSYESLRPYLERARAMLRTAPANTDDPALFHVAFVDAAQALGFPLLGDLDDLDRPVGAGAFPANVVGGARWNAALAYLDGWRGRPNLTVLPETLADRIVLQDRHAVGVVDAEGQLHEADVVVLAAGAYFSPAILFRSGIGPDAELKRLAIPVVADLPVGERLLDHCGVNVAWAPSGTLRDDTERRSRHGELFAPHALLKAASGSCPPDAWDLHLVTWIALSEEPGDYERTSWCSS